jgi:hypothetical protein
MLNFLFFGVDYYLCAEEEKVQVEVASTQDVFVGYGHED